MPALNSPGSFLVSHFFLPFKFLLHSSYLIRCETCKTRNVFIIIQAKMVDSDAISDAKKLQLIGWLSRRQLCLKTIVPHFFFADIIERFIKWTIQNFIAIKWKLFQRRGHCILCIKNWLIFAVGIKKKRTWNEEPINTIVAAIKSSRDDDDSNKRILGHFPAASVFIVRRRTFKQ